MKKFRVFATLIVVALCATTIFTSCRNDDDDDNGNGVFEIRATNVAGNTGRIATVRAEIWGANDRALTVGEAPFQNNGFTLRLIDEVPTPFLSPITDLEYEGTLTISDRNARMTFVIDCLILFAYDSNGNAIGYLGLGNERDNEWSWGTWVYIDRNVTVSGTTNWNDDDWEVVFDLNLRRGWNTIYFHENENTKRTRFTSQRPSGWSLIWEFSAW